MIQRIFHDFFMIKKKMLTCLYFPDLIYLLKESYFVGVEWKVDIIFTPLLAKIAILISKTIFQTHSGASIIVP